MQTHLDSQGIQSGCLSRLTLRCPSTAKPTFWRENTFLWKICQAGRCSHLSLPCSHNAEPTNGRRTLPERKAARQAASQTCTLVAGISLRALVPVANADALTIGIRLLDRLNEYNQYSPYWTVRPQVGAPVVLLKTTFT